MSSPRPIKTTLEACLHHRKKTIQALQEIETAWRVCSTPLPSLNKAPLWPHSQRPQEQKRLRETEEKLQEINQIQQKAFLMFQPLAFNLHQTQLAEGNNLLNSLPTTKTDQPLPTKTLEKVLQFFLKERKINQENLQNLQTLQKTSQSLTLQTKKAKKKPCSDPKMQALLNQKLQSLEDFLKTTKEMARV